MSLPAKTPSLSALAARFDRQAIEQLRAEVARLSIENEELRRDNQNLDRMYQIADRQAQENWEWAIDMQFQLCELTHSAPGITQSAELVMVPQQ